MDRFNLKNNWWMVIAVAAVLAIAIILIAQAWLPAYEQAAVLLALVILGIGFLWAYLLDRERRWWALIIPLAVLTVIATVIVAAITPQDASGSSPFGVITLGLGAAIIGFILKRPTAKLVLYAIAVITLLVGILMLPIDLIWKILLIVVEVALVAFLALPAIRKLPKTGG